MEIRTDTFGDGLRVRSCIITTFFCVLRETELRYTPRDRSRFDLNCLPGDLQTRPFTKPKDCSEKGLYVKIYFLLYLSVVSSRSLNKATRTASVHLPLQLLCTIRYIIHPLRLSWERSQRPRRNIMSRNYVQTARFMTSFTRDTLPYSRKLNSEACSRVLSAP